MNYGIKTNFNSSSMNYNNKTVTSHSNSPKPKKVDTVSFTKTNYNNHYNGTDLNKSRTSNINSIRSHSNFSKIITSVNIPATPEYRTITDINGRLILQESEFVKMTSDGTIKFKVNDELKAFPVLSNELISDYVDVNKITNIQTNGASTDFYFEDGSVIHIIDGSNSMIVGDDSAGNTNFGYVVDADGNMKPISIYGNYTRANRQYGGNQVALRENVGALLEDPKIWQMLEDQFPGSTYWEKANYITSLSHSACGFVGEVNGLFEYYSGKEQEFKDTFGFDMYNVDANGNIDFNYEYLILEFYNYGVRQDGESIYDVINDAEGFLSRRSFDFQNYLSEYYGVNSNCSNYYNPEDPNSFHDSQITPIFTKDEIMNTYYNLVDEGKDSIMIGSWGYYLRDYDTGAVGYYSNDGEGHAMSVVGEENGNLIVTSWGKKYILDLDYMNNYNYGYSYFYTADYD